MAKMKITLITTLVYVLAAAPGATTMTAEPPTDAPGATIYTVPPTDAPGATIYTVPPTDAPGATIYTVPPTDAPGATIYTVPPTDAPGATIYTVPPTDAPGATIYTVPPTDAPGATIYTVPPTDAPGATIYTVPPTDAPGATIYTVPPTDAPGATIYTVPPTDAPGATIYTVPPTNAPGATIYTVPPTDAPGATIYTVPPTDAPGATIYTVPPTDAPGATIYTVPPTDAPGATIYTVPPTDAPVATTADPGCNETLTANTVVSYFNTQNYPNNYDSNMDCHILITSPADTAIVLNFVAFSFEAETYCIYDYFSVYDQSSVDGSRTLIGTYCGTHIPGPITSSHNTLYIRIFTDSSVQSSGADVGYNYFDNSYPNCKSGYTSFTASAKGAQIFSNANQPYLSDQDEYFIVVNPGGDLILQLTAMSIERASGCIYDRITIYNGACTKDAVLDIHCGTFLKRWELTGSEYLVHFHSDSSIQKNGFTMEYFLGTRNTGAPTTTTTTVGPPVSAEVFLVNDILANYSTENFPVRNLSVAVDTTVDVYLAGINDLDEVQQKLTTTIQFEIRWRDEGMRWPASKQSGITKLLIPQNDIWKPDLALVNSFTKITAMGHKFMFIVVENDGQCTWKPLQILESTCKADMTDYPYDTQVCELKFSTWSSSSSQIRTIVGPSGMTRHESFVENSEWHLKEISQRNETINNQLTAVFILKLKRNHSFIVFYVTIPVVLLSLLSSLTFAMPVDSGEKVSYAITVFLSFLIYLIVTFQKMPENSDTISLFAMYVLIMTGISNLTVIIAVLEVRMSTLTTKHKPMMQCAIRFSKRIVGLQHRMLCIASEMEEKRYCEAAEREENMKAKRRHIVINDVTDDIDEDEEEEEPDQTWPEFVSTLDFVCFWVFLMASLALTMGYLVHLSLQ